MCRHPSLLPLIPVSQEPANRDEFSCGHGADSGLGNDATKLIFGPRLWRAVCVRAVFKK